MSTSRQPVDMYGKDAAQGRERGKLDCILLRILRSAFLAVGVGTVGLGSFFLTGSRLFMVRLPS